MISTKIKYIINSMMFKQITSTIQDVNHVSIIDTQREECFDVLDSILGPNCFNQIYHDDREDGSFAFSYYHSHPEIYLDSEQPLFPTAQSLKISQETPAGPQMQVKLVPSLKSKKDKHKNSNTIKKYGRLILDHLKEFDLPEGKNLGIENMMKMLNRRSKNTIKDANKRDRFNTYHLKELLKTENPDVNAHNLKITRIVLNKYLRKNVLASSQISQESKMTYMNTLKCCSLRCLNTELALRLQMACDKRKTMISE